jgi:SAM-dependent methyltransferase
VFIPFIQKERQSIPMNTESVVYTDRYFGADADFDRLYTLQIQRLAQCHWTPLAITKLVLGFIGINDAKILDIGSGVGKFCLTAAHYAPNVNFIGVEQRKTLVAHARQAQHRLCLPNASFINANFTQLKLRNYDHFYFFNSFYENIDDLLRIDNSIDYSWSLYNYYITYLFTELSRMPVGTRIATYHSGCEEIPDCYNMVETYMDGFLKFWIKL